MRMTNERPTNDRARFRCSHRHRVDPRRCTLERVAVVDRESRARSLRLDALARGRLRGCAVAGVVRAEPGVRRAASVAPRDDHVSLEAQCALACDASHCLLLLLHPRVRLRKVQLETERERVATDSCPCSLRSDPRCCDAVHRNRRLVRNSAVRAVIMAVPTSSSVVIVRRSSSIVDEPECVNPECDSHQPGGAFETTDPGDGETCTSCGTKRSNGGSCCCCCFDTAVSRCRLALRQPDDR